MTTSYGKPPTTKPLDEWSDDELRDAVSDHFERHKDEDSQNGMGSK